MDIENPSAQGVAWQATLLSGAPWLTLTHSTGTSLYGAPAILTFRADRLDLMPATYIGRILVQPITPNSLDPVEIRVQICALRPR